MKLDPRLLIIQKQIAGVCRSKWKGNLSATDFEKVTLP